MASYQATEPYVQLYDVLKQEPANLFQADGMTAYDPERQQIIYLYYYAGRIVVWDTAFTHTRSFPLLYTSDHLHFKTNRSRAGTYLRESPVTPLHSRLRIWGGTYLIQTRVIGAAEDRHRFVSHTTVDVYSGAFTYAFSFRIPDQNQEKVRDFYITDQHIIVLYPTRVVVYDPDDLIMAMDEQEKPNT